MECARHPGETVVGQCLECGKNICSKCVLETGQNLRCTGCYRIEVSSLAERLKGTGGHAPAGRPPKEPKPAKKTGKPRISRKRDEAVEAPGVTPPPVPRSTAEGLVPGPTGDLEELAGAGVVKPELEEPEKKEKKRKEARAKKTKRARRGKKKAEPPVEGETAVAWVKGVPAPLEALQGEEQSREPPPPPEGVEAGVAETSEGAQPPEGETFIGWPLEPGSGETPGEAIGQLSGEPQEVVIPETNWRPSAATSPVPDELVEDGLGAVGPDGKIEWVVPGGGLPEAEVKEAEEPAKEEEAEKDESGEEFEGVPIEETESEADQTGEIKESPKDETEPESFFFQVRPEEGEEEEELDNYWE